MNKLRFDIDGMTCGDCAATVREAIAEFPGVESTDVDLEGGSAEAIVERDDLDGLEEEIARAVSRAGYETTVRAVGGRPAYSEELDAIDPEKHDGAPPTECPKPNAEKAPNPEEPAEAERRETKRGESESLRIDVGGMTCATCVRRVEEALSGLEGAAAVRVNFATERARVDLEPGILDEGFFDRLRETVEEAGYEVESVESSLADEGSPDAERSASRKKEGMVERRRDEIDGWRRRALLGLVLSVPVTGLQMGPGWLGIELSGAANLGRLGLLAYLTTVVVGYVGREFAVSGWNAVRHGSPNMDTLVSLGTSVAWLFSLVVTAAAFAGITIGEGDVYFDAAVMILTLISAGKWLEARAKGKAGEAIESLLDLAADTATVERGGSWTDIPVRDVREGDRVLVRPGEKIPTDGAVVEGRAEVDESMITGESVPVAREPGDEVIGATLNENGRLVVRATRVGEDSALAQIVELVERAQESRADVQRLADRVSGVFVPTVIAIAALTFLVWSLGFGLLGTAILASVAVLIVACPCALGLATPTAIMVGTGIGARHGVLIRDAQALEEARSIDALVFDKTGTLTTGEMTVRTVVSREGWSDRELIRAAAGIEAGSDHPLADAIVERARDLDLEVDDPEAFESFAGRGVRGELEGRTFAVGKPAWLLSEDHEAHDSIDAVQNNGETVVAVTVGGELAGYLGIADTLKEGAGAVVEWLESRDIEVWMLTGDNEATARAVAQEAGIPADQLAAEVRPDEKVETVESLQRDGERVVAMVGDGINDAPALARADIGIALGTGTDVAIESADITLISGSLDGVRRAVQISRLTYRKIVQNLGWAFIYNILLIPVAALGMMQPAFGAAAMAASDVCVIGNALSMRLTDID